jgi:hypothetical protein
MSDAGFSSSDANMFKTVNSLVRIRVTYDISHFLVLFNALGNHHSK